MNIVIPIKQVPETSDVKMDKEKGTMIRDGVQTVINPLDLYALEAGIELKEKFGGKITVITMGPPSAVKALKEAVAMGCDDAILLSDKEFAGSDTWATSYTLAEAIKEIKDYDLVIAGERATDGDTGQVGPGIAAWLDLPLATYVSSIETIEENSIVVERLVEEGYQKTEASITFITNGSERNQQSKTSDPSRQKTCTSNRRTSLFRRIHGFRSELSWTEWVSDKGC